MSLRILNLRKGGLTLEFDKLDELEHHGVKGMKWGQHIFGKDKKSSGSRKSSSVLNDWKKKRKAKAKVKAAKEEKRKAEAEEKAKSEIESKRAAVLKSRSAKTLYENAPLFTTDELDKAYRRLVLEKNINDLEPAPVGRGKKFIDNAVVLTGKISTLSKNASSIYGNITALRKMMSKNNDPKKPPSGDGPKKPPSGGDDPKKPPSGDGTGGSSGATGVRGMKWRKTTRKKSTVYEGEIIDAPTSTKSEKSEKKTRTTIDLGPDDWSDVTDYTESRASAFTTAVTTTANVFRGKNYADTLRKLPIAGLLE